MSKIKLLVIDDEISIRRFLRASIDEDIYELIEADNGKDGIRKAATESPNIILLDLGLPDIPGEEVATQIREWSEVPIIVLSAKGDEANKVRALDQGVNDYLTKPFGVQELFARIRAALRTSRQDPLQTELKVQDLTIDLSAHTVFKGKCEVHLTRTEFKLLALLAKHCGKMLTHRQILREVWGLEYEDELHYLRVYAQQLRAKIEDEPTRPKILITETGVGYRLRE